MAYVNFDFYGNKYFGDVLTDKAFPRWADEASDWLDTITFQRLVDGLPTDEWNAKRVQKCVCRLADTLYLLDEAQKNASISGNSSGNGVAEEGKKVKSVSSGSESITYMTPTEQASGAKEWSAIYTAASDKAKTTELLMRTAKEYLSGVSDDSGTLLLYAGV